MIGRPNVTFAIDLFSPRRAGVLGVPRGGLDIDGRDMPRACLPAQGRVAGPAGFCRGFVGQSGASRSFSNMTRARRTKPAASSAGCAATGSTRKSVPRANPEQHGTIERLIGTMMRMVHELRGTTWSNIAERGDSDPAARACLALPELERILTLAIDKLPSRDACRDG